jgi:hypothetical protein
MRATAACFKMRLLLVLAGSFFLLVSGAAGLTDFSGAWVLDLRASSSPEPILKRLGASWVERTLGSSLQLQSTYIQTPDSLTVQLRGPAFNRTDVMRIDNKPETKEEPRTGRYTIRTFWSAHGTQLVSTISLRTKDSRDAQFSIVRELTDGGKTLVLTGTLKVTDESGTYTVRRVWRKR